jgi:hypothetical protein
MIPINNFNIDLSNVNDIDESYFNGHYRFFLGTDYIRHSGYPVVCENTMRVMVLIKANELAVARIMSTLDLSYDDMEIYLMANSEVVREVRTTKYENDTTCFETAYGSLIFKVRAYEKLKLNYEKGIDMSSEDLNRLDNLSAYIFRIVDIAKTLWDNNSDIYFLYSFFRLKDIKEN